MNIVGGEGKILDMNEKFTLEDNSFSIIVADICLHFFNEEKTIHIMNAIKSEKEWNFNCKSFYLALMINITHLVLDMKYKESAPFPHPKSKNFVFLYLSKSFL